MSKEEQMSDFFVHLKSNKEKQSTPYTNLTRSLVGISVGITVGTSVPVWNR